MSQEQVELVRRTFDLGNAFMRGELSSDAYAEIVDPQIELRWHDEQTYPDTPQHLQGAPEFMAFVEQYRSGWDDLVQEPFEIIEVPGDRLLVFIRQSCRGPQSGVPIVIHFFQLCAFRGGKLRQIEYFRHRTDALEAAGLPQ